MLPRERMFAALSFEAPDVVPVEYHASPSGFLEHGERLRQLWSQYVDDFGPPDRFHPSSVDPGPRTWRDAWGVQWSEKAFGAGGIPTQHPLSEWPAFADFRTPPLPATSGATFESERIRAGVHRQHFFLKSGWISLFELMHALRPFEDTLIDIASGEPRIEALADRLTEYHLGCIDYWLARGVDAIQFGDDFGTQSGLILSPPLWRSFFKPRYEVLIRQIKRAGAKVFFHTCGNVRGLLEDIVALGVDAIWPQLNAYDLDWLSRFHRQTKVAVALHPDRGELMIRSSPNQVRTYVAHMAEIFEVDLGGSWFYVEVDRGFPFENVAALTEAIRNLRLG